MISFFLDRFKEYDSQTAMIWQNHQYTYRFLLERIEYWRTGLSQIPTGAVVGLESDFSPETVAILFILIERCTIIVPFDIHNADKNRRKTEIAQLDFLIQVVDDQNITVNQLSHFTEKGSLYKQIVQRHVAGLVLFTSGSSGAPKGAVHDFSKLLAKFELRRKALRTINFLLFDHWGGLNTLFHILSNGGAVVILENRNPDYVCELVEKHKVELLPTSPTFLNLLILSKSYQRHSLDSLKVISYGAEPMPETLLTHLNSIFPHVKFQQTYGLIELGVMRSQSESNGSLWVRIGGDGYQTRVIDNILQIKSDSAMLGYLNAPSPFTDDGWFITGDSVEVKGEYFRILGRKSELINVGGEKVFPQEVENLILSMDGVLDVVVYGEKHPFTGNIVCARVALKVDVDESQYVREIKSFCRRKLESYKVPVKVVVVQDVKHSDRYKKERNSNQ